MSVTAPAEHGIRPDAVAPPFPPLWADQSDLVVWDGACGTCPACRAGRPAACGAPIAPPATVRGSAGTGRSQAVAPERVRRRAGAGAAAAVPALLAGAATAAEVVRDGPAAPAVIVRGDGPLAHAAARAAADAGAVAVAILGEPGARVGDGLFAAADPGAVRAWIAPRAARGRADLVLAADGDLAAAAKLVRRGGAIAAVGGGRRGPATAAPRPSVTTLVQRELELLRPRDLVRGALTCALPPINDPGGPDGR